MSRLAPILLILFCLIFTPGRAVEKKTLTIAADVWCPINCEPGSAQPGIGIELARRVFTPLGYEVRYEKMPWSRALEEVRAGRVDAVVGANQEDDPTLLYPRTPICAITDDFYIREESTLLFTDMDSLAGQRIGIIKDYGYSETINRFLARQRKIPGAVQVVGGDDALEQNIRKLLAKRIDVVIESGVVMDYTLKRLRLEGQIKSIGGIPQGHVYLGFSPALKASRQRVKEYDEGIAVLAREQALAEFYKSYGIPVP